MMSTSPLPKPLRLSLTRSLNINSQNAQWGRLKNGWVAGSKGSSSVAQSHYCSGPQGLILGQILFNVFINGWGDGTVYLQQVCRHYKTGRSSWYTKWLCHSEGTWQARELTWGESDEVQQREMKSLVPGEKLPYASTAAGGWLTGKQLWKKRPEAPGGHHVACTVKKASSLLGFIRNSAASTLGEVIHPFSA